MSGTAYPSGAPEFIPGFLWGSCCSIFIFLCCVLQIIVCYFLHFGHCIICPASIYGFCLPLWYLKFRPFLGLSNWPLINVREKGLHQLRFSILYTLDYGRLNMITFIMPYFTKIIIKEKPKRYVVYRQLFIIQSILKTCNIIDSHVEVKRTNEFSLN